MATLHLQLVSPVETLFDQEVEQVIADTEAGQVTILPNHTHLVSILRPGELVVRMNGEDTAMAVAGGTIEMSENKLVVLADAVEGAHDIDVEAAQKRAKELAAELETQEQMDITTYNNLQRQLAAEQAKLRVANKWRG